MAFENSETYKNIKSALAGESIAATKYLIYAGKAEEDGFQQIKNIFNETSHNEKEHAEIFTKLLNDGKIPSTVNNLKDSISGEHYEWTQMYNNFARIAMEEGYKAIANIFLKIASVEQSHDERFLELIKNIESEQFFCKPTNHTWLCTNCGYSQFDKCAPNICPLCGYSQSYFEIKCKNY